MSYERGTLERAQPPRGSVLLLGPDSRVGAEGLNLTGNDLLFLIKAPVMLAPVHLRFTSASGIQTGSASNALSAFLSSEQASTLLANSSGGPGTRASLARLLKGLQDEQLAQSLAANAVDLAAANAAEAGGKKSSKELKRKNKEAASTEGKRKKVKV